MEYYINWGLCNLPAFKLPGPRPCPRALQLCITVGLLPIELSTRILLWHFQKGDDRFIRRRKTAMTDSERKISGSTDLQLWWSADRSGRRPSPASAVCRLTQLDAVARWSGVCCARLLRTTGRQVTCTEPASLCILVTSLKLNNFIVCQDCSTADSRLMRYRQPHTDWLCQRDTGESVSCTGDCIHGQRIVVVVALYLWIDLYGHVSSR